MDTERNSGEDEVDIVEQLQAAIRSLQEPDPVYEQAVSELEDYLQGISPADIHEGAPLKLEQAICLPELQGHFAINPEFRTPSESLSIKTLRKAIADGHLAVLKPNSKNIFVTRRAIKEWLASCQDQGNPRTSNSERNGVIQQGGSHTKPSISSTTTTSSTALDAALTTLAALKGSSKPT